jgi:hypothetical protein
VKAWRNGGESNQRKRIERKSKRRSVTASVAWQIINGNNGNSKNQKWLISAKWLISNRSGGVKWRNRRVSESGINVEKWHQRRNISKRIINIEINNVAKISSWRNISAKIMWRNGNGENGENESGIIMKIMAASGINGQWRINGIKSRSAAK